MSLDRFIRELHAKECEFKISPDVVYQLEAVVTNVVKDFLPSTLSKLPGSKDRFSIEEIANAGSYFEQTKIIAPDEYDFMVVIRELSEPGVIIVDKGCREGYVKVKVTEKDRWGTVSPDQTQNRSFTLAVLEFNAYIRQAFELTKQLPPFQIMLGELSFNNIVSRGKPYKQFSYVQTAYFKWKYNQVSSTADEPMEVLYSRIPNSSPADLKLGYRTNEKYDEVLDLDVDLMACCRVPLEALSGFLPQETLDNPILSKHGCHIVLKPCGNPKCIEEDTECRLISYTKSEQETMRNLHPNWKTVYRFMKWLFHFTEVLGVDSYKLKTGVLHQSHTTKEPSDLSTCMRLLWKYLLLSSSKGQMPSFFNPTLNVWNISPCFKHMVKWEIALLSLIIDVIDKTPVSEYDYEQFRHVIQTWFLQFCANVTSLLQLEKGMSSSDFEMFCVQGNIFMDIIRAMETDIKHYKSFRNVAFRVKCRVFFDVMKELTRFLVLKVWNAVRMFIFPRTSY